MIDVTKIDKVEFVKKVYELSRPQGLGMLHYTPSPLSDEEAKSLIQENGEIHMDYVKGRSCKFHSYNRGNKLYINDCWYDHTDEQFEELLSSVGLLKEMLKEQEHGCSCNCDDCRQKRGEKNYDPISDFREIIGIDGRIDKSQN